MLSTARPIFEQVPASFADPLGLADQQAPGVVSLIVVAYGSASDGILGATFDGFVAASGQLLAVARTTPDYRFPVTPADALHRFIAHRDARRRPDLRRAALFQLGLRAYRSERWTDAAELVLRLWDRRPAGQRAW